MAYVPEVISDLYAGIPKECFVCGVPDTLRGHEDNEIIPLHDRFTVRGPDGVQAKWIRFCDFLPFLDSCKSYWMHSMLNPLYVYVMPYTPLRDAMCLHDLVEDRDQLEDDEDLADLSVEELEPKTPEIRQGEVEISDGVILRFSVVNYKLLWLKACKYRLFSYIMDPLLEYLRRLQVLERMLLTSKPRSTNEQLVLAANDARRRLALTMLGEFADGNLAADPHDALFAMFSEVHDAVYQGQCRCYAEFQEDPPTPPLSRIEDALQDLGYYDDLDGDLSINQSEYNLLNAESAMEFHSCHLETSAGFSKAKNTITSNIYPTIEHIGVAINSHSLLGVPAGFEDGNTGEED